MDNIELFITALTKGLERYQNNTFSRDELETFIESVNMVIDDARLSDFCNNLIKNKINSIEHFLNFIDYSSNISLEEEEEAINDHIGKELTEKLEECEEFVLNNDVNYTEKTKILEVLDDIETLKNRPNISEFYKIIIDFKLKHIDDILYFNRFQQVVPDEEKERMQKKDNEILEELLAALKRNDFYIK